ncbi:hypothetical protein MVEG_10263 [Podila verticillata NRRL 6337]|nr:hypothetical protein MVEG_10263 [Podila verticillata NRRL 6337]
MAHANFLTICFVFIAALTVFVTVTEAVNFPIWCYCRNSAGAQYCCKVANGNWDGGSCGLTNKDAYSVFEWQCNSTGGGLNCWN